MKTEEEVQEYMKTMYGVPEHLRHGLAMYLLNYVMPGHFLMAVLENDLLEAFKRGDRESREGLGDIVHWLYNYAVGISWGSKDLVRAWLHKREE